MAKEITLNEYKKAYRMIISEEERRGFFIHLIHCIPPVSDWCSMWYTMCSEGSDPSPKGEQAIGL
ncbi:MAG: hypothetical protein ACOCZQ_01030 [Nanoarchaeota archaeon]